MQRVNSVTVSPLQDQANTRYPIRIGAVAQQPAPDLSDVLYVGLVSLLPEDLRARVSCAGLFFARVICCDTSVDLEVAALARYFADDDVTFERHVRRTALSSAQFAQLLEWDRRLAGMATSDVREIVEAYAALVVGRRSPSLLPCDVREIVEAYAAEAARVSRVGQLSSSLDVSGETESVPSPEQQHVQLHEGAKAAGNCTLVPQAKCDAHRSEPKRPKVVFEREAVIVPLTVIQALIKGDPAKASRANVDRLLLRAALQQVRRERQETKNREEHHAMRDKERRIRRIYQLSQVPTYKLIEAVPVYGRGKHGEIIGCRVDIDVPVMAAA